MKKILTIILCGLAAAANAVTNQSPTNITTTSAWARVSVSAGTPVLQVHYGMTDAGTNLTWASTNAAVTGAVGTVSQQITGLTNSSRYYYRFRNNSTTNWAAGGSIRFYTAATSPTGTPSPSANAVMVHPTTDVLLAPTNFFGANTTALNNALSGFYDPTGSAVTVQADLDDHKTNINVHAITAITGLQTALDGKAGTNDMAQAEADITDLQGLTNSTIYTNTAAYTAAVAKADAAYPSSNPSNFYLSANPSNWVDASITNGLYSSSNPSNFVTASVTDGLYSASNPSNYVTASITDGLYSASNPSNFVTASVTDGLYSASNPSNFVAASVTNLLHSDFTNHTANGQVDIQHLTAAQKLLATNSVQPADTNGWTVTAHEAWLTNETYLGTISTGTVVAGSANSFTVNGTNATITWDTNAAGGGADGADWSSHPATQTVAMASNDLVNVDDLLLSQFGQIWEKYEVKNIAFQSGASSRGGSYSVISMTNQQAGAFAKFLVLTPLNRTNVFLETNEDFANCMVLMQDGVSGSLKVGINRPPAYALDVAGASHFDSIDVISTVTTNIQITGGATNEAVLVSTNNNGTGKWKVYPKIQATKTSAKAFPDNTYTAPGYDTLMYQNGGTWDGTNWTPGVVGMTHIIGVLTFNLGANITVMHGYLQKNGAYYLIGNRVDPGTYTSPSISASILFYNDSETNVYRLLFSQESGVTMTNHTGAGLNWFSGTVLP